MIVGAEQFSIEDEKKKQNWLDERTTEDNQSRQFRKTLVKNDLIKRSRRLVQGLNGICTLSRKMRNFVSPKTLLCFSVRVSGNTFSVKRVFE